MVAVDPAAPARERATALGPFAALDPHGSPAAVAAGVAAVSDGGVRVSIDAVGLPETAAAWVRSVDYPGMLARVADGSLRPRELVGREIGLDEAAAALAAMGGAPAHAGMTVIRLG